MLSSSMMLGPMRLVSRVKAVPRLARYYGTQQKLRKSARLWFHEDRNNNRTRVAFSPDPSAIPIGAFPTSEFSRFERAFTTDPDLYENLELLDTPEGFEEDSRFWPLAGEVLRKHIHECPIFSSQAAVEKNTPFFHIYDLRSPPPYGRIPEVEDIMGTVRVAVDKGIVPGSMEVNTMYRPLTRHGAMVVSDEIAKYIREASEKGE